MWTPTVSSQGSSVGVVPPILKVWACGLAFAGKFFSARGSIHYQPKMGNVSFGRGIMRRCRWAWAGGTEYSVDMVGRCNNERGNTPKLRGGGRRVGRGSVTHRFSGVGSLDSLLSGPKLIAWLWIERSRDLAPGSAGSIALVYHHEARTSQVRKNIRSRLGVFPFPHVVWLPLWWNESDRYYPGFEMNKTGSWGPLMASTDAPSVIITFQLFLPMWRRVLRR